MIIVLFLLYILVSIQESCYWLKPQLFSSWAWSIFSYPLWLFTFFEDGDNISHPLYSSACDLATLPSRGGLQYPFPWVWTDLSDLLVISKIWGKWCYVTSEAKSVEVLHLLLWSLGRLAFQLFLLRMLPFKTVLPFYEKSTPKVSSLSTFQSSEDELLMKKPLAVWVFRTKYRYCGVCKDVQRSKLHNAWA